MSDQEMQFADPEWQPPRPRQRALDQEPYTPQPLNSAPREHADNQQAPLKDKEAPSDDGEYSRGYRAEQPGYQYTSASSRTAGQQTRRRRSPWFWIILIVVVVTLLGGFPFEEDGFLAFPGPVGFVVLAVCVVACIMFMINRSRSAFTTSATSSETRSFSVGMQPKIVIRDTMGTIRVHPGSEDYQVVVQATRRARGWPGGSDAIVHYEQDSEKNRITVKVNNGWSMLGRKNLDFDITVPRQADLELKTEAGSIDVTGISGQMSCSSDAGSVRATEVALRGDSKLKTDAGSITFAGSLDPFGSYHMTTDAGSVNVTIPEDASFQLDAKTDVGSIHSDFPLNIQRDFPGSKARSEVGAPPYAKLKLRTDVGSINLRKG